MTAAMPIKHKPFNLEHAKAGAPIAGAGGERVRVLIWDRKHPTHPIIAIEEDGDQEAVAFAQDGSTAHNYDSIVRQLVMTPLGYIDGLPVFVGDRLEEDHPAGGDSEFTVGPTMRQGHFACARWPAPAKVYPESTITVQDLAKYKPDGHSFDAKWSMEEATSMLTYTIHGRCKTNLPLQAVANAALRHAIDAGQVVTDADHHQVIETVMNKLDRATRALTRAGFVDHGAQEWKPPIGEKPTYFRDVARDMAVAEAVRDVAYVQAMNCQAGHEGTVIRQIDLGAIIAKVPV